MANTGEPIPEEIGKGVNTFYRINKKKKERQQGGSELRLAICREILQHENSRFGVRNEEQGPEFFFSLKKFLLFCNTAVTDRGILLSDSGKRRDDL